MYAIIATGAKQYKVTVDELVDIELVEGEVGGKVVFDHVLATGEEQGKLNVGAPMVAGATVEAEIVDIFRGKKVIAFKMKRRKSQRRMRGHRQNYTRVKITAINVK
ncbi:MAG: 50S ribosomal protein L21 [Victivallaceae bacterium]|nr:50S ribosomal protein L21 [Victivallaceae bacterium]